jgi:hypothetical protein
MGRSSVYKIRKEIHCQGEKKTYDNSNASSSENSDASCEWGGLAAGYTGGMGLVHDRLSAKPSPECWVNKLVIRPAVHTDPSCYCGYGSTRMSCQHGWSLENSNMYKKEIANTGILNIVLSHNPRHSSSPSPPTFAMSTENDPFYLRCAPKSLLLHYYSCYSLYTQILVRCLPKAEV